MYNGLHQQRNWRIKMSKVDISKGEALKLALDAGLVVTKEIKNGSYRSFKVGNNTVHHDKSYGGCACWKVNDERGGYVGEAILKAISIH
jgi:hypothetical protein